MPDLRYNIKSKADLKAVKQTEQATKDLGNEVEKTTRKLKEQTRATKQSDKALQDAKRSGDGFAKSIGKQVFGSLVSFAVVERAVQSLKTVFAPALRSTTEEAGKAGDALGRLLAAGGAEEGIAKPFKAAADAMNAFADAAERVNINLEKTLPKLDDPRLKGFAAGEGRVFAAESGAFAEADARALSAFDAETSRQLGGQGITNQQKANITKARTTQRADLVASFSRRDMDRLRDFQGEQVNISSLIQPIQELNSTMRKLEAATGRLEKSQADAIMAEQRVAEGRPGTTGLGVGITGVTVTRPPSAGELRTAAQMARRGAEADLQERNRLADRVRELRAQTFGISNFQELADFEARQNATLTAAGGTVARTISGREGASQAAVAGAGVSARALELQGRQDQTNALLKQQNELKAEQIRLINEGIALDSDAMQALSRRNRELESRIKELRNVGGP